MIARNEMLDALNLLVLEAFSERTVYRDTLPNEFERPSSLIALDKRTVKDGNDGTVEITQPFRIQVIGAPDVQEPPDTDTLQQDADAMEQSLWRGYLPIADRCVHIEDIGAKREPEGAIRVYGKLHYFDDRPQMPDQTPAAAEILTGLTTKEDH